RQTGISVPVHAGFKPATTASTIRSDDGWRGLASFACWACDRSRFSSQWFPGLLMAISWRGVFPAVTTLFHAGPSLDLPGTLPHVDRLLDSGVHGLIMLGTVGENCSLEAGEKRELLGATVQHVGARVPVLCGVAEYTTALACRWSGDAARLGADGLMVLPPMV